MPQFQITRQKRHNNPTPFSANGKCKCWHGFLFYEMPGGREVKLFDGRRAIVLSVLLLLGCATPYQQHSFRGGYSDYQMAEDMFSITFKGNGYTSAERTQIFALRRASEVALKNGFQYFIVLGGGTGSSTSYIQGSNSQTTSQVNSYGTASSFGNVGTAYGTAYGTSNTNTSSYAVPVTKYGTSFQIKCFKSKPESNTLPLVDAKFFLEKNFPDTIK